jgi:putative endonuclease
VEYYVYIIYSLSKDKYYIGYSHDPEGKLLKHNLGATPSTRAGRPWTIVHNERFDYKSNTIRRESEIKKMKSRKYIEELIKSMRDKCCGQLHYPGC